MTIGLIESNWISVKDADPRARSLYLRHYSAYRYTDGRRRPGTYAYVRKFVGPGEHMVLLTLRCDALFVWRKFIDKSGQTGVNCAVFRNEGDILSSELVKEACDLAWSRWSGERLYTYVNQHAIRSTNPGYCFKKAGWTSRGFTKDDGYVILALDLEV